LRMNEIKRIIGVVPIGDVPELVPKVIAAHISGYMKLAAEIIPPLQHPHYAYDEKRFQYDAGSILMDLNSLEFTDYEKIIGVLNVDLFVPILTYVFGEAKLGGTCGLVSLYRLEKNMHAPTTPASLVYERAAKVALHELGHLFSLVHCDNHHCLMHFSGSLSQLDEVPLYFCKYCSTYLKDAFKKSH
jgi:archaemetzincin